MLAVKSDLPSQSLSPASGQRVALFYILTLIPPLVCAISAQRALFFAVGSPLRAADHDPAPALLFGHLQQAVGIPIKFLRRAGPQNGYNANAAGSTALPPGNAPDPLLKVG